MTMLVTGGAGFIGSNFIFYWTEKYPADRIICLDCLTYAGNYATLTPLRNRPNFRFVRADVCNRDAVNALFDEERPDVVVHFAAESHVDRAIADPGVFLQTNVIGTAALLDACRKYGVTRYHQISTDEVYGDLPLDRPDLRFTEASPIRPSSPYSASKAAADLLVQSYYRTYGLPVTISRCSNNYGPYQFPEKLIPRMIDCAWTGQPLPVYGEGRNVRDWIYVTDHCAAVDRILHDGRPGAVYNIGGGCERCNLDVVRQLCGALGVPESRIIHVADRKGHDLRYAIDSARAERELGWRPKTAFADGLARTVEWYRMHRSWLEAIRSGAYRAHIPPEFAPEKPEK